MIKAGHCTLTAKQEKILLNWVKGEIVYDLGAGDLSLTLLMARQAKMVHAVDKIIPKITCIPGNVYLHQACFNEALTTLPK